MDAIYKKHGQSPGETYPDGFVQESADSAAGERILIDQIRQRAAVMAELGTAALRGEPIQSLMDKAMRDIALTMDVELCKILKLIPGRNELLLVAGVGWPEDLVGDAVVPAGRESQAGYTLLTSDPVIVQDFATESRFAIPQLLKEHGVVSGISVIIHGVSGPWGILGVHSNRKRLFSQGEINFVQTLSNILAEAIERKTFVENLRQSEEKFRGLLETAPDGIVISNDRGEIEIVNEQLERMTGYRREELIGRKVEILIPARFTRHELYRKEFLQRPNTKVMGERTRDLFLRRMDGSEFPVEISLAPLETEKGMVISAVLRDITLQKHAEQIHLQSQRRLRNLAQRLNAAREEERTTVARDIHDELGQTLTGLKIDLSWLSAGIPEKSKNLRANISTMISRIETTIDFVRKLSTSLRPAILDDLGLEAAIEWQMQGFAARTGCRYTLDLAHADIAIDNNRDTTIFRIFQEALTNVARHAGASRVDISLRAVGQQLVLSVSDNGTGIGQEKLTDNQSLGLIGMYERASAIGGKLQIEAGAGGGTRIILMVPSGEEATS